MGPLLSVGVVGTVAEVVSCSVVVVVEIAVTVVASSSLLQLQSHPLQLKVKMLIS